MLAVLGLPASAQAAEPDFHRCRDAAAGARCGHVGVPLDRLAPAGEKIRIGFELYRRRDRGRPALGTIVAVEGGPGYSSTDSRDYYLRAGRPLMGRRDLLLVDARGTGLSGPLDCPALRRTVAGYIRRAGRCAAPARAARRPLHDARRPSTTSPTCSTRSAIGAVDLYGDSYGSYFGQAFAVDHPDRLRSLVLDGTYPLPGTDPRWGDLAEATWRGAAARLRATAELRGARRGSARRAAADRRRVRARPVRGIGTRDGRAASACGSTPGRWRRSSSPATATCRCTATCSPRCARSRTATARRCCGSWPRRSSSPTRRPCARSRTRSTSRSRATTTRRCGIPRRRSRLAGSSCGQPEPRCRPRSSRRSRAPSGRRSPYEGATACLRWPGPRAPSRRAPQAPLSRGPDAGRQRRPRQHHDHDQARGWSRRGSRARPTSRRATRSTSPRSATATAALPDRAPLHPHTGAPATRAAPADRRGADGRALPPPFRRRHAGRPAAGDRSTAARPPRRRRRGGDRRRRDPALAPQLRRQPRGLRGGRWTWSGDRSTASASGARGSAATSRCSGGATWRLGTGAVRADLRIPGRGRLRARWNVRRPLATATLTGRLGGRRLRATMLAP